jgi:murein DD-endopeptidase MepM/ murein hydrolase activator NlpD
MINSLRFLALILVVGLLAIPTPATSQDSGPVYIVQAGDTLSAIARRFGVSQEALITANAIADPARLFPGDTLVLPGFPGIDGELALRTLELGETLTSISRFYGVGTRDLARLNRMLRPDTVYAGQALIVPVREAAVDQHQGSLSRLTLRGETPLELAAQAGIAAWEPTLEQDGRDRYWRLPGTLFPEKGETGTKALPSLIRLISLSPSPLVQGKTAIIQVGLPQGYTLSGSLGDASLTYFPHVEGHWVALQGIHALADPGLLDLRIVVNSGNTTEPVYAFSQRVLIREGDYGFQYLNGVPPETVDPANTEPENNLVEELLAPKTESKLWQGTFDYPSRYYTEEFISFFGTRRNYNNGALLFYHTGLDFYGQNVPIYAPADGVVVYADFLTIRGNVTYLDHGWGVYSGYLHQGEILVAEGEYVERGEVIGLVGATGRVTGPHLHWEIWVGGIPVEPLDWVRLEMP